MSVTPETCPTCGSLVTVRSTDEGTNSYEPFLVFDAEKAEHLAEIDRFIHKVAEMPDDAMMGSAPSRILSLIRAKARQLEQYDDE